MPKKATGRAASKPRRRTPRSGKKSKKIVVEKKGESKTAESGDKNVGKRCQIIPGGFAGTGPNGSFFESPEWVDTRKAPGLTPQPPFQSHMWLDQITGKFMFFSPNLVWLCVALADYFYFPYDFESAKQFEDLGWVGHRALVNLAIVLSYVGFWHVVLYAYDWSKRPFNPTRVYKYGKVAHNVYYTCLGTLQYTVWEAIFMHCYATKRLPCLSDSEAFGGDYKQLSIFVAGVFIVPIVREFHFYFAHRFLHIKAFYKYIHSLHHRNTDIEPFAGLCMHPVEHLYYYTSTYPSLFLFMSPFSFMWNGIHLLISPAASHSGFEDHMQSDQYHYLHHRYFECNYGTGGTPLDKMFGTFRDQMRQDKTSYKGAADLNVDKKRAAALDGKANLFARPELGFSIYIGLNCFIWSLLWFAVSKQHGLDKWNVHGMSFLVSVGPLLIAQAMTNITERCKSKRSIFYPFHKDGWKALSMHLLCASLMVVAPVYIMIHMLLSNPGDSFYFWVRSRVL
jgi:sterol desaturase/sphingolipid hydroxylase (fatty acid hydroxylase superfamily)